MDISIEKMTLEYLNNLSSNLTTEFDDFWNFNILYEDFNNPNCHYFIAKLDNKIVGFFGISIVLDEATINNIVVNKYYRNQGIGNLMIKYLINFCSSKNVSYIFLEVNEKNLDAYNLYKKNGFEDIGIRKKYYNNCNDAIVMKLLINSKD